jgi:Zn finger protein HypA/HybF involved in hydrogenase expression
MRHYTIKMMNGLSTFKCVLCKHSVTTREFSAQNGSCRTQAARVMNDHAMAVHGSPKPMAFQVMQPRHAH